jgi:hypothetical protein
MSECRRRAVVDGAAAAQQDGRIVPVKLRRGPRELSAARHPLEARVEGGQSVDAWPRHRRKEVEGCVASPVASLESCVAPAPESLESCVAPAPESLEISAAAPASLSISTAAASSLQVSAATATQQLR